MKGLSMLQTALRVVSNVAGACIDAQNAKTLAYSHFTITCHI